MKAKVLIGILALVLGLSACGSSTAANKQLLQQYINHLRFFESTYWKFSGSGIDPAGNFAGFLDNANWPTQEETTIAHQTGYWALYLESDPTSNTARANMTNLEYIMGHLLGQ